MALAWLLHNPIVTAPIIGPRTMEQLESAVRAAEIELDQEPLDKLDEPVKSVTIAAMPSEALRFNRPSAIGSALTSKSLATAPVCLID